MQFVPIHFRFIEKKKINKLHDTLNGIIGCTAKMIILHLLVHLFRSFIEYSLWAINIITKMRHRTALFNCSVNSVTWVSSKLLPLFITQNRMRIDVIRQGRQLLCTNKNEKRYSTTKWQKIDSTNTNKRIELCTTAKNWNQRYNDLPWMLFVFVYIINWNCACGELLQNVLRRRGRCERNYVLKFFFSSHSARTFISIERNTTTLKRNHYLMCATQIPSSQCHFYFIVG